MPGKPPRRIPQGTVLSPSDIESLRASGASIQSAWTPQPFQTRILQRTEFEILAAGGKYSGKTECGRIWMVGGNPDKPNYDENGQPILCNMSYVYHPHFLGVVVRLNEKDLAEWVDRARPYYEGDLGGTYTKNPAEFRWPSGARVFLGHAQDTNAYTKYQGQNIVRFLIEEAGQIPDLETLDQIRSCCRSLYPEMRAQILYTANPGGRGQVMLFDRFIEPKDRHGIPIKHPMEDRPILESDKGLITIEETARNPFTGETLKSTRVWVPGYLSDNAYALRDTNYIATLATMSNEKLKRAYLFGDWKALRGTYFDNFSRATHTYDPESRPLAPWWRSTASLDWGFVHESAAYWHKRDPETRQNLVYKEFVTSRTDPVELGAELARQSRAELEIQGSIVFHVSHDLYHERIGEFTWVELIQKGAQKVLGSGTCAVPDLLIARLKERAQIEGARWSEDSEHRLLNKEVRGIVFRRAPKARAVGFMYLRSLMRLEMLMAPAQAPDWEMAMRISTDGSTEDFVNYLASFKREVEILPELLISRACPVLIDALQRCVHSEENPEDVDDAHFRGMDSVDSLRYLMAGIRDERPSAAPKQLEHARLLDEARRRRPELSTADMIWIARGIEDRDAEEERDRAGFSLGRGRLSRRLNLGDPIQ